MFSAEVESDRTKHGIAELARDCETTQQIDSKSRWFVHLVVLDLPNGRMLQKILELIYTSEGLSMGRALLPRDISQRPC